MIPFPCPSLFQQLFCRLTSVTSDLSRCDGDPGPFTIWATALPEPLATTEGPSTEPNLPIMDVTKKRSKRRWEPGGAHICYSTGGKFQNPHPSDLSMTDQDRGTIQSPTSKTSSCPIIAYRLRKNKRDCSQWQRNSWTRSNRKSQRTSPNLFCWNSTQWRRERQRLWTCGWHHWSRLCCQTISIWEISVKAWQEGYVHTSLFHCYLPLCQTLSKAHSWRRWINVKPKRDSQYSTLASTITQPSLSV